jgi:hypothetical protein
MGGVWREGRASVSKFYGQAGGRKVRFYRIDSTSLRAATGFATRLVHFVFSPNRSFFAHLNASKNGDFAASF